MGRWGGGIKRQSGVEKEKREGARTENKGSGRETDRQRERGRQTDRRTDRD